MAAVLERAVSSSGFVLDVLRLRSRADYVARRLRGLRSPRRLFAGAWRALAPEALRAAATLGSVVLPYRTGSRMISWMSGQRWMRATVFRRQVRVVRQWQALPACR